MGIESLIKSSERGTPLLVDLGDDHRRVAAEIFRHANGIVFMDIGWCAPMHSGHPAHLIEGEVTGDGPWMVGDIIIREIEASDPEMAEYRDWIAAREEAMEDGLFCDRETAARYAASEFPSDTLGD